MRKIMLLMMLLVAFGAAVFAQEVAQEVESQFVIDLGTFTGVIAIVSVLVTQLAKVIPIVSDNRILKIAVSVLVGIAVCTVSWTLQLTDLLVGYTWWQVLLYGVATGLSGCGFYDIVKAIGILFKK